jgi:RimJ/RimL family protein N-acetyltransferase
MIGRGPGATATNTHRIETERLLIEVPTVDDAHALFDLVGGTDRVEITEYLIWDGPDHLSETREFIEKVRTEWYGANGFHWVIRDRHGLFTAAPGTPMGMIGTRPSGEPGRGDVGYWLGKPYWGRGIMREALASMLDLAFGELDMIKLEAEVFTGNARSIRLVESLGMQREGTIRSAHLKRGDRVDAHVYGMLREEWERDQRTPFRSLTSS